MVESKKALPKETRPSFYGSYGPPFTPVAAAAAMAMAAAHAARQGNQAKILGQVPKVASEFLILCVHWDLNNRILRYLKCPGLSDG